MNTGYEIKFRDSSCILLVDGSGTIQELFTPFSAVCIESIGRFTAGQIVEVQEVAEGEPDSLIYLIGEGAYYHRHFHILAGAAF